MNNILDKLKGGDLRSIGKADEVALDVLNNPGLFEEVFNGIMSDDPLIRMRSADVIEKVLRVRSEYLAPYKKEFLECVMEINQQEVRWHAALMMQYLKLDLNERDQVVSRLFSWIDEDDSRIVKVNAMQALSDLAEDDKLLQGKVLSKFQDIMESGSPAMVSRAKKLIKKLSKRMDDLIKGR